MTFLLSASRAALALALLVWIGAAPAIAQDTAADAAAAQAEAPADPNAVLARVGDSEITEGDLALAAADFAAALARVPPDQRRQQLLAVLIDMELLAQAAEEAGLDQAPDFGARMEFLRKRALRNAYVESEIVAGITDDAIRAEYERVAAEFQPEEEVRARHILVETREEAESIIAELQGGADFAALAAEHSTDPGSGPGGGDLGFFTAERMVPSFSQAAFALQPGEITEEPVQSQFGWHVIKVEERRQTSFPPLEQVADRVREMLLEQRYEAAVEAVRAETTVEVLNPADDPDAQDAGAADGAADQPEAGGEGQN